MLVVMKAQATEEQIRAVCEKIEELGYRAHSMPGAQRTAIGITGNRGEVEPGTLDEMPGVQELIRVSKPYKLVSRDVKAENTVITFPGTDATFGGPGIAVIAGPCAIESREQTIGGCRACVPRRRAIFPGRRLQAAHLAIFLSGHGRRRPADHGRGARQIRHENRHRGDRQRIA